MTLALGAFTEWVQAKGGEILSPTNEWEILRYQTSENHVGIIWQNKKGLHTFSERVKSDYPVFVREAGLAPTEKTERLLGAVKRKQKSRLLDRDGATCCYCGQFFDDPPTIEHFHSIAGHGNNHDDNCALACQPCNLVMGSLPVVTKIHRRDQIREAMLDHAPWEYFDARSLFNGVGIVALEVQS